MSKTLLGIMMAINLTDGQCMDEACELLSKVIAEHGLQESVGIAAINASNQLVISGKSSAVKMIQESLAFSMKQLSHINCAFHSPLMRRASEAFPLIAKSILEKFIPNASVISNLTGLPYASDSDLCRSLSLQISNTVQWHATIKHLLSRDYRTFAIMGPPSQRQ